MKKINSNTKKGFTIIEVVLVLAIAGLIFLMVFVALPALQRSQRDTQRRQDYADLSSAIANYMTNNNGRLPKSTTTLAPEQYINADGNDPNGTAYTISVAEAGAGNTGDNAPIPVAGEVYVYTGADCNGTNTSGNAAPAVAETGKAKAYAIYGYLETGTYCQSSN